MNADKHGNEFNIITDKIIQCVYKVGNKLGVGFLEKVYENALCYELSKAGLNIKNQYKMNVIYENIIIGEYFADIFVENKVIIELIVVKKIDDIHFAQCINYLKISNLNLCLLINFYNPKIEIKRIVNDF